MARTEVRGGQVKDASIQRDDLDAVTTGQAVVRKLIQGTDISLSSTGVDAGTGDVTVNGAGTVSGAFALTGSITPPQITATQDDYNPTGLSGATVLRLASDATRAITGLAGGASGRVLIVENIGDFTLTFATESANSAAANRFVAGFNLLTHQIAVIRYDSSFSTGRWLFVGYPLASANPPAVTPDASADVGAGSTAARNDHQHGMATYASTPVAVGTGAAGTSATAPARGDHVHATGAGTPSTQAFGDAAATGSGPAASMTDHKHAFAAIAFSIGGTILSPTVANVIAWRAPFACTVTALKGYRVGGTGATVNAGKGTTAAPTSKILASDLSLTSSETWQDGGAVQNTAFAAGDPLVIIVASLAGTPTEIGIQVDYTRP